MASGEIPASLPFIKKRSQELLKADYAGSDVAQRKIVAGLREYYRSTYPAVFSQRLKEIDQAAQVVASIYDRNVFPDLKVTWGTYSNNLGHTDFTGCFRCHDEARTTSDQKTITQDCTVCHNLLAVDEPSPDILKPSISLNLLRRLRTDAHEYHTVGGRMKSKTTFFLAIGMAAGVSFAADASAGKADYDKACKTCHGVNGTANAAIAKSLKVEMRELGSKEVQSLSDADIHKIITEGHGKMKPVKTVSGPAVDNVVAYVRSLKK